MADEDYIKYELELDNNKIIKSGVSIEQIKNILFLAYEGMKISVINENNAEN